jgi:hypothetical protein
MTTTLKDLLGRPASELDHELLAIYERVKALRQHPDAAPCVVANLEEATVALWNAVNDLLLVHDEPD